MASEVSHRHSATGDTLYFTIRNTSSLMWNTAGTPNFETLTVANWTDYDVAMTESPASSYFYVGTFPAISGNMVAGWYWVDVFNQAGASPAIGDSLLASYFGYWDGTIYKWWGADELAISGDVTAADNLETMLDGTGGKTLSLARLVINGSHAQGVLHVTNTGAGAAAYFTGPDGIQIYGSTTYGIYISSASVGIYADGAVYDIQADIQGNLSGKVTPIDVDGITFASAMEAVLAVLTGVAVPSGSTVVFKKRDGTTTKVTITYGTTDGERTASVFA